MDKADQEIQISLIEAAEELLSDLKESFLNNRPMEIEAVDFNIVSRLIEKTKKVEQKQQEIDRLNKAYEYISNAIYTQHCTMNHMENTEFERGQIRGLIQASNIVKNALGNTR